MPWIADENRAAERAQKKGCGVVDKLLQRDGAMGCFYLNVDSATKIDGGRVQGLGFDTGDSMGSAEKYVEIAGGDHCCYAGGQFEADASSRSPGEDERSPLLAQGPQGRKRGFGAS